MINTKLLGDLGLKVEQEYGARADSITTKDAIKDAIRSACGEVNLFDYFIIGAGAIFIGDFFTSQVRPALLGSGEFNAKSVLEIIGGVGLYYIGMKSVHNRKMKLRAIANSLADRYVNE